MLMLRVVGDGGGDKDYDDDDDDDDDDDGDDDDDDDDDDSLFWKASVHSDSRRGWGSLDQPGRRCGWPRYQPNAQSKRCRLQHFCCSFGPSIL